MGLIMLFVFGALAFGMMLQFSAEPSPPEGSAGFTAQLILGNKKIGEARDIRFPMTRGEIETTSQDTDGWKSWIPGLAEASMEFTLYRKHPESEGANALRMAFLAGTIVRGIKMIDKFGYGWQGDLVITDCSEDWSFENAIQNSVRGRLIGKPTQLSGTPPTP